LSAIRDDDDMIDVLKRTRRRFFGALEAVLFVLMLALLALISLQVFTRYVLNIGLPWTEEVARMVLVWTVMIGAAIAMDRNEHYAITFIADRLKGVPRLVVLLLVNVIGLVFLFVLVRHGMNYVSSSMTTVYVSTQVARGWIYLALPVGAAIMMVSLVLNSIEAWHSHRRQGGWLLADRAPGGASTPAEERR
jgi:TRAP-type C4-dicarboxylate transport system permease small subunit